MPNREEINARLSRVNIHGNDYVTVNQRVQGFWAACPEGRIETKWLVLEPDRAVCQATVSVMDVVVSQGTAMEERSKSGVNSTSFLENCETSAVGRALGFFGIGSVESIASADEVMHAIDQQEEAKQAAKQAEAAKKKAAKKEQPQEPAKQEPQAATPKHLRAVGEARKKALAVGVTDKQMFEALQHAIGKNSKEYTEAEAARAVAIIEQMAIMQGVANGTAN